MRHETLAGLTDETLGQIKQKSADSRVREGLVAIEAAHYVSMGAELFGSPIFNVGDKTRAQLLESPVQFTLMSLERQYPTRTTARQMALRTGTAIARGEGKNAVADYLELLEENLDSSRRPTYDLTEEEVLAYRNQGD